MEWIIHSILFLESTFFNGHLKYSLDKKKDGITVKLYDLQLLCQNANKCQELK